MIIANTNGTRGVLAFLLSLVIVFSCGCGSLPWRQKTNATVSTPSGAKVAQSGNVEIPAHVETNQIRTEIPLSASSKVSIVAATAETPAHVEITAPANAPVIQTQNVETATAPKTVAPPTPTQLAQADGVRVFYYVAAGLAVLALILGYAGHVKAAAFAFLGAVGIPFAVKFLNEIAASFVGVAAICIAGTLFAAWFLVKDHPEVLANLRTKLQTEESLLRSRVDTLRESARNPPSANPP